MQNDIGIDRCLSPRRAAGVPGRREKLTAAARRTQRCRHTLSVEQLANRPAHIVELTLFSAIPGQYIMSPEVNVPFTSLEPCRP